jgi:hypothetical protein
MTVKYKLSTIVEAERRSLVLWIGDMDPVLNINGLPPTADPITALSRKSELRKSSADI